MARHVLHYCNGAIKNSFRSNTPDDCNPVLTFALLCPIDLRQLPVGFQLWHCGKEGEVLSIWKNEFHRLFSGLDTHPGGIMGVFTDIFGVASLSWRNTRWSNLIGFPWQPRILPVSCSKKKTDRRKLCIQDILSCYNLLLRMFFTKARSWSYHIFTCLPVPLRYLPVNA